MDNLYSLLGLTKESAKDEQTIKKAYRKKSFENHPDRMASKTKEEQEAAEQRMRDINKAYEILSDPKKKEIYDLTGSVEQAEKGEMGFGGFGGGFGGFDGFGDAFGGWSDLFGNIFGGGRHRPSQESSPRYFPGSDLQIRLRVTIEELFNPKERRIRFKRDTRCPECHGAGGESKTCEHCHGTGRVVEVEKSPYSVIRRQVICPHCGGTGRIITKKCKNSNCVNGFVKKEVEKTIIFPQGVQNGQCIIYQNEGNESKFPQGLNGNLIVIAQYDINPEIYTINGADVVEKISVNYEDCILGQKLSHTLPSGNKISLTIPPLTPPNKIFKLKGKGLKVKNQYDLTTVGDYYIEIEYKLPKNISNQEIEALQSIKNIRQTIK